MSERRPQPVRGSEELPAEPPHHLLIHGYDIRVIHAATGEIIRDLTINPERRYHGTGQPPGGPKGPRKTNRTGP